LDELDRQLEEITRQWTLASDVRPRPVQDPRPPIIVGGRAKPRTVATAVRFADEYNTVSPSLDEARQRARVIALAAEQAGRQPLVFSMTKACVVGSDRREVEARVRSRARLGGRTDAEALIQGIVGQVVEALMEYRRAGVERVMLQHLHHEDVEMVALLGEVSAALAL
jgi:alkanesulfonate monooxygenase SsuD/methylene tetrahydromethanopterin reductase-like flavin-dependent oxidoreductase (luciferase family)